MTARAANVSASFLALERTVTRYLDAIGAAGGPLRRRERTHCQNLLAFLGRVGGQELTRPLIERWLVETSSCRTVGRRQRLSTLRRVVALLPGPAALDLAVWLDQSRTQLCSVGSAQKVVPLRPVADRDSAGARSAVEQAEAWHRMGEPYRARALARRAARLDPCCLRAHAMLGVLSLEADQPGHALRQFRAALVLSGDPSDRNGLEGVPEVLHGLGRTLLRVGCFEEAREVFVRLRYAGPEWRALAEPVLGRIAIGASDLAQAAVHFAAAPAIHQFNVAMVRMLTGEPMRTAIAYFRGLLANPHVPPVLLERVDLRFQFALGEETSHRLEAAARAFAIDWGPVWTPQPELLAALARLWDHPLSRSFLMRALPLCRREPASPRLAVYVHSAATELSVFFEESGLAWELAVD